MAHVRNELGVYLGGPITGLTLKEATRWRTSKSFLEGLSLGGWHPLDPLDPKYEHNQNLDTEAPLEAFFEGADKVSAAVGADLRAIRESSAVLFNFSESPLASIGSSCELGYASALGKPIISVLPEKIYRSDPFNWVPNPHYHPFITELSDWVVPNLGKAVSRLAVLWGQMTEVPYA